MSMADPVPGQPSVIGANAWVDALDEIGGVTCMAVHKVGTGRGAAIASIVVIAWGAYGDILIMLTVPIAVSAKRILATVALRTTHCRQFRI